MRGASAAAVEPVIRWSQSRHSTVTDMVGSLVSLANGSAPPIYSGQIGDTKLLDGTGVLTYGVGAPSRRGG